jgi:hypothetical protein
MIAQATAIASAMIAPRTAARALADAEALRATARDYGKRRRAGR